MTPKLKNSDNNILNVFKKNSKKNNNAFKSRTINITRISNPSSKEKSREKNLYERFHTKDNINERYNYKSIPLKLMESKSNSKEKINKALKKFEKNTNYGKQYCATLNQQPEQKQKYLSLNTHSNSNEKKRSRPSTAIIKTKNKKFNNDGFIIYNQKNFAEFSNFRDNLLSNNKKEKDNINKKFFAPKIHKNINLNNIINKHNNKLFIKTNNNTIFNNMPPNIENNNIFTRTIFNNEKRLITPKIGMNHLLSESNRPKSGKKLKLASALMLHHKKDKKDN